MKLECVIELEYGTEEQASAILSSISPDNGPYAQAKLNGRSIKITATASNPMSLLHTMEDLLACVKVAEEATIVTSGFLP